MAERSRRGGEERRGQGARDTRTDRLARLRRADKLDSFRVGELAPLLYATGQASRGHNAERWEGSQNNMKINGERGWG